MAAMMEKPRDVVSGVVVMAIGAGFLLNGLELERGSSFRMGPGYFPTLLSVLMIGLGMLITVLAIRKPATESGFGGLPWKGLALIIGATVLFGFTLRGLGLGPVLVAHRSGDRMGQPLCDPARLGPAVPRPCGLLRLPVHPAAGSAAAADRPLAQRLVLVTSGGNIVSDRSRRRRRDPRRRHPIEDPNHGTARRSRAWLRHGVQPL